MPLTVENTGYKTQTILGGETRFNGILRFKDSLRIDGHFEGTIESPGFLVVEGGANVKATINVGTLVVGGIIHGNVSATEKIEFLPGGLVIGNIRCPSLVMAEGTGFRGRCEMLSDQAVVDIFSMPLDRLKKNLVRVD